MLYPAKHSSAVIYAIFALVSLYCGNAKAFLSDNVTKTMAQANECKKIPVMHTYQACMSENNSRLRSFIDSSKKNSLSKIAYSKRSNLSKNIDSKITSILRLCQNEQQKYGDSHTGQRRQPYCIYENMLEVLINIERNIKIYAH